MDQVSQRSLSEASALQEWVHGSLQHSYGSVLREELPQELLDLLPER